MGKVCSINGCSSPVRALGMCKRHYEQTRRLGTTTRTRSDKNEIIKYEDYAEIILYDKHGIEKARTKISLNKVDLIKNIKWHLEKKGYVVGYKDKKPVKLHRYILNATDPNILVDHKMGDKLDNRTSELRVATSSQNSMNRKDVKGVNYRPKDDKYYARIMVSSKSISLGYFDTKDEAINARLEAEIKYFGEFRYGSVN